MTTAVKTATNNHNHLPRVSDISLNVLRSRRQSRLTLTLALSHHTHDFKMVFFSVCGRSNFSKPAELERRNDRRLLQMQLRCSGIFFDLEKKKKTQQRPLFRATLLVDEAVALVDMKGPSGITGPYGPSVNV